MTARYLIADVFDGLDTIEDGSVDLVVTSPPFLALRSYLPADDPLKSKEIGSEPTPAAFLDVMLRFTAELRRVVAPHGSIAIELGDTYAGSGGAGGDYDEGGLRDGQALWQGSAQKHALGRSATRTGDKGRSLPGRSLAPVPTVGVGWPLAKSKTLIPELYRIALAYGINPLTGEPSPAGQWRVRNVVTWARPNPPVGALGDKWRPATSDVVVACISAKRYWDDLATRKQWARQYDDAAVAAGPKRQAKTDGSWSTLGDWPDRDPAVGAPLLDYWEIPLDPDEEPTRYGPKEKPRQGGKNWNSTDGPNDSRNDKGAGHFRDSQATELAGTPLLDYWVIPPGGYTGSHYAVFPPELVVPLVKAMCPEKVCRECGQPSRRIVSTEYDPHDPAAGGGLKTPEQQHQMARGKAAFGTKILGVDSSFKHGCASWIDTTEGWTDCGHDNYRPGLVLDPFAGSGTTLLVATGHGHDAIGIDLDRRNAELALERVGPFMLSVEELETH